MLGDPGQKWPFPHLSRGGHSITTLVAIADGSLTAASHHPTTYWVFDSTFYFKISTRSFIPFCIKKFSWWLPCVIHFLFKTETRNSIKCGGTLELNSLSSRLSYYVKRSGPTLRFVFCIACRKRLKGLGEPISGMS